MCRHEYDKLAKVIFDRTLDWVLLKPFGQKPCGVLGHVFPSREAVVDRFMIQNIAIDDNPSFDCKA